MTDSRYTVPAMRDAAETLRVDAAKLEDDAEAQARQHVDDARRKAKEMRHAAAEIDADAEKKLAEQRQGWQQDAICPNCQQPIVDDGLGWKHVQPTSCHAYPSPNNDAAPMDATVVDPQPEAQVPEGEGS